MQFRPKALGKEFKYDSLLNLWKGVNMSTIKVAIAGVGNCASSLVQGVEFYKDVDEKSGFIPGIAHNIIGHYRIRDIQFVAAFDVDKNKVGKDLSEAIFTSPNCAMKF